MKENEPTVTLVIDRTMIKMLRFYAAYDVESFRGTESQFGMKREASANNLLVQLRHAEYRLRKKYEKLGRNADSKMING